MARFFVGWYNDSNGRWEGVPASDADQAFDAANGSAANSLAAKQTGRIGKYAAFPIDGATAAFFNTQFLAPNSNLSFTARGGGTLGNNITIQFVISGNNTPLTITTNGLNITVNVATNGTGQPTSTANQVKAALDANATAASLILTTLATGNDGSGVVAALTQTPLGGGDSGVAIVETLEIVQTTQATGTTW
jgi:hypothetical protein